MSKDMRYIGDLTDIPVQGARVVRTNLGDIAVFRTAGDEVYALRDRCPHKAGPLSQGIVHGAQVTCPLHNWVIDLASGEVVGPDEGCVNRIAVTVDDGRIFLDITAVAGEAA